MFCTRVLFLRNAKIFKSLKDCWSADVSFSVRTLKKRLRPFICLIGSLIHMWILKVSNCGELHSKRNSLLQQRFSIILLWFDNSSAAGQGVWGKSSENYQLIAPEGLQLILNLNFYETGFSATKRQKAHWGCAKWENIFSLCVGSRFFTAPTLALADPGLATSSIWPVQAAELG